MHSLSITLGYYAIMATCVVGTVVSLLWGMGVI
jgi:hypothetical protein